MGIKITASANTGSACRLFPKMIQYFLRENKVHLRMCWPVPVGAGAGFFFYLVDSKFF